NGGRFHDRLVLAGRLRPLTWLHRASQACDTRLASIKDDTVLTSIHYHASPGHPRAGRPGRQVTAANPRGVTRREIEVLALVGARLSNAEIADRLQLSVRTVENHVSSLLRKYGVADRRALAEVAAQVSAGVSDPGRLAGAPAILTRFIGRDFERALLL